MLLLGDISRIHSKRCVSTHKYGGMVEMGVSCFSFVTRGILVVKDWLATLLFWSPALEQLHLPYSWLDFFHFRTCAMSLDLESMLLDGRVRSYTKEDRIPYLLAGLFVSQD